MKTILTTALAAMATGVASVANAGTRDTSTHWFITTPSASGNSDATGALVLLLLVGAVILMNNGTTTRNTQQTNTDQNDDDVIMKF